MESLAIQIGAMKNRFDLVPNATIYFLEYNNAINQ